MPLTRIVLRLARNPGYPDGDHEQGYVITAPIDPAGLLQVDEWKKDRASCTVIRFKRGEERDADGWLTHRGDHWHIRYDEVEEGPDEPVYRLGDHRLGLGDYITVHESDGQDLTYRVTEHHPVRV